MPRLECPAKVNLFLEIVRRRPDGFHDLESVFTAVPLCDTLTAEPTPSDAITLECTDPAVPTDNKNTLVRAANLLREQACRTHPCGIHFHLNKRIPMGAGLGGGSSDAAGALLLANQIWQLGLSRPQLAQIGLQVGSDVPFFLTNGVCLCRGRGEIITPLPRSSARQGRQRLGLLTFTKVHCATGPAFARVRLPRPDELRTADAFVRALEAGDLGAVDALAFNRFEESFFEAFPMVAELVHLIHPATDVRLHLTGSGASFWFLNPDPPAGSKSALDKITDLLWHEIGYSGLAEDLGFRLLGLDGGVGFANDMPCTFNEYIDT